MCSTGCFLGHTVGVHVYLDFNIGIYDHYSEMYLLSCSCDSARHGQPGCEKEVFEVSSHKYRLLYNFVIMQS